MSLGGWYKNVPRGGGGKHEFPFSSGKFLGPTPYPPRSLTDAYLLAEDLRQLGGDGVHPQSLHHLLLRPAEVAAQDDLGPRLRQELDGRARGREARSIGHHGRGVLGEGCIEIHL